MKEQLIAYCGLDCEKCEARIATLHNDEALRQQVAKKWSEWNHVEITPDQINCMGCRTDGIKTVYCQDLCPIRACASEHGFQTCGSCSKMETCSHLSMIIGNNEEAKKNLTD